MFQRVVSDLERVIRVYVDRESITEPAAGSGPVPCPDPDPFDRWQSSYEPRVGCFTRCHESIANRSPSMGQSSPHADREIAFCSEPAFARAAHAPKKLLSIEKLQNQEIAA